MESATVTPILDSSLAQEPVSVGMVQVYTPVKSLARVTGLLVGISSGANVAAALEMAWGVCQGSVMTILRTSVEDSLSERPWEES